MNIIVAADRHWAIGKDGRGLVTIPADQQMLMRETAGKVVVMGRKTLEGLPGGQPLGSRVNVVLSRNEDYKVKGAQVCGSMAKALETLSAYDTDDIYIIGGLSIYEQFLPHADTVHVTRIDYTYKEFFGGDVKTGLKNLPDRKSTRLNSSHIPLSRMPSSA